MRPDTRHKQARSIQKIDSNYHKSIQLLAALFLLLMLLVSTNSMAEKQQPAANNQVHAVLFYQPLCSECPSLIDDYLVPLTIEHIDNFVLASIETNRPGAKQVIEEVAKRSAHTSLKSQIPVILIGDQLLVGETEIRKKFPKLLTNAIQSGGLQYPEINGLDALIRGDLGGAAEPVKTFAKIDQILAWLVLAGLLSAIVYTAVTSIQNKHQLVARIPRSVFALILAAVGIGISSYLSYIELGGHVPTCGPVGDCAAVQSSPYAQILGIPMAVLGLGHYLVTFILWTAPGIVVNQYRRLAVGALLILSIFGAAFSVYLTALELFVIHAVCLWCLGSAVISIALLLIASKRLFQRN